MDQQYKREFPDFDREIDIPEGFEDISWHNDTCPSFHHLAYGITMFVDYADLEKREFAEGPSYTLSRSTELGAIDAELGSTDADLGEFEEFSQVLDRIRDLSRDPERRRRVEIERQARAAGFEHDSSYEDNRISLFWKGEIDGREARIGGVDLDTAFPAPGDRWSMTVLFPESGHKVGIEVDDFAGAVEAARVAVAQLEAGSSGPKH